MRPVILLGPQRLRPTVIRAVEEVGVEGQIAAVTAGWQERECEVDELSEHLGRPVVQLELHRRAETLFLADHVYFEAYRARQEALRQLQELYRRRLGHVLDAAREVLAAEGPEELIEPERESALEIVRMLDRHHLERIQAIHRVYEPDLAPKHHPLLAEHQEEIRAQLAGCTALAIAGGHVLILLNRLRLFDIVGAIGPDKPVFAWSAGAMCCGRQIVVFHDSPPQGAGNAEVIETGLALYDDVLALPHARHRLRLEDPLRVTLLARRFTDMTCVAMDEGAMIRRVRGGWRAWPETRHLLENGTVEAILAA